MTSSTDPSPADVALGDLVTDFVEPTVVANMQARVNAVRNQVKGTPGNRATRRAAAKTARRKR